MAKVNRVAYRHFYMLRSGFFSFTWCGGTKVTSEPDVTGCDVGKYFLDGYAILKMGVYGVCIR